MPRALAALIFLICTPTLGLAWGDGGHRAVAEIAKQYLSQEAVAGIEDLLTDGLTELVDEANWADHVVDERPYTYYWHVVQIPIDGVRYDRVRDCKNDDCIVERITQFAGMIGDRSIPKQQRTDALKYLVHAENRSFDHLYGLFPGANGLQHLRPSDYQQRDRDGSILKKLPPVWGGLTAEGVAHPVTEVQTAHLPNKPFAIDDPTGLNTPASVVTRDPLHRFYENQMQINGGKNDRFVAYSDVGALVMGNYDGSKLPLWNIARQYALADNFFMAAFGGSFLNHFWLVCACTPYYPNADQSTAKDRISMVEADGVTLKLAANSPKSAINGPPIFVRESSLTPDFYAVNTMQPPYQPSRNKPAAGGNPAYADPGVASTLPPQTQQTIGDLLTAKGVSWTWYAGAWQATLDSAIVKPDPHFQYHHQPFNYFVAMAPGTTARAEHLRDGGLDGSEFIKAAEAGTLPQIAFYKPQGSLNKHAGYADTLTGDQHIADVIERLQKSPQWPRMLIIVTYDENGGFWDHVAPPKGDRWGPGTRVPAIIVSPFAKKGFVDHTQYDTTSILRFITKRFALPMLPGLRARDEALAANGHQPPGDLTNALDMSQH